MTEKKNILFLNRRQGERIILTINETVIEIIVKETTKKTARIGIRTDPNGERVEINRADAEDETLEAIKCKKLDLKARKKLKEQEKLKKLSKLYNSGI